MILNVAYVLFGRELGGKVLGVRVTTDQSKQLCQAYYNMQRGEGNEQMLEWIHYVDEGTKGEQAPSSGLDSEDVYYVEEKELEIQSRDGDPSSIDWKDRLVLQKTIENGRLAEQVIQTYNMIEPLEERVEQLGQYIDTLLGQLNWSHCTFKTVDGADELWEVNSGNRVAG